MYGDDEFPRQYDTDEDPPTSSRVERRRIPKKTNVKEYNIGTHKHQREQIHSSEQGCATICCFALAFFILSFGLIFYFIRSDSLPIQEVQDELLAKVLNQYVPVYKVLHSLKNLNEIFFSKEKHLMFLVGPTGVGKSYLINILSKQISSKHLKIFYSSDLPQLIKKKRTVSEIEVILTNRYYTEDYLIIVFDDLKPNDSDRLIRIMEIIKPIDLRILILVVFNEQSEDCSMNLSDSNNVPFNPKSVFDSIVKLSDHGLYAEFNYLDEGNVKQWIKIALAEQNVELKFHEEIIKNLLVEHNIKCSGLKGLQSKLLLELSKYN